MLNLFNLIKKSPKKTRSSQRFQGEAIVEQEINFYRKGRVKFKGSWWFATCDQDLSFIPGDLVEVVGIKDITLIVKPRYSQKTNKLI